jgi:hypothetical protein
MKHWAAVATLPILVAACSGSSSTSLGHHAVRQQTQTTSAPASPVSNLDADNPGHDPNKCVLHLADGTVVYTIIEPIPPGTPANPAAADKPITPTPPLGTCG